MILTGPLAAYLTVLIPVAVITAAMTVWGLWAGSRDWDRPAPPPKTVTTPDEETP